MISQVTKSILIIKVLFYSLNRDDSTDVLCVGEWNGTLSFYNLNGKTNSKDRSLPFVPLKIVYFPCGQYILVTGSNKQCLLLSSDGIQLAEIGTFSSWTWCCSVHPDAKHVVSVLKFIDILCINRFEKNVIYLDSWMSRWNSYKN